MAPDNDTESQPPRRSPADLLAGWSDAPHLRYDRMDETPAPEDAPMGMPVGIRRGPGFVEGPGRRFPGEIDPRTSGEESPDRFLPAAGAADGTPPDPPSPNGRKNKKDSDGRRLGRRRRTAGINERKRTCAPKARTWS